MLVQPVRVPSAWSKVPLLVAAVAAMAWLVLARVPPRTPAGKGPPPYPGEGIPARAQASLTHLGPSASGWTGRVIDAHDAYGLGGARVAIERPNFEGVEILAQTIADAHGAFELPPREALPGDVLVVEGPLHAALRRPLPPVGGLTVQLLLRKRVLLERLVAWARRRGKPFDARPEPTPAHVRGAAAADLEVARWANAVEQAAFGGTVVDERVQHAVDGLAPAEHAPETPTDGPSPRAPFPVKPFR
jgi:hypothetical protein